MAVLEHTVEISCAACGASRCAHDGVLARLLGCESSGLCLECLAFAFGLEPVRFARGAVAHLQKKSCLWLAFERASGCGCALERARVEQEAGEGRVSGVSRRAAVAPAGPANSSPCRPAWAGAANCR